MRVFSKYLILCISLKLNSVWNEINASILFGCECYYQIVISLTNSAIGRGLQVHPLTS